MLALAVPDKRWCFDCLKQVSTTGQMLAAHRTGAQRHGLPTRFDFSAYIAYDGDRIHWGREPLTKLRLADNLEHAYSEFLSWSADPNAPYVDCHAWHFTPASFELLIVELGALGVVDWRLAWLGPQPGLEFFVRLVPGRERFATPEDREARRLELLKRILLELREQTDWLLAPASPDTQTGLDPKPNPVHADAEMRRQVQEIAETAAMLRSALRPARAVWRGMLPLRRTLSRLRGQRPMAHRAPETP